MNHATRTAATAEFFNTIGGKPTSMNDRGKGKKAHHFRSLRGFTQMRPLRTPSNLNCDLGHASVTNTELYAHLNVCTNLACKQESPRDLT